jgi:tetratricopeptide (TPR) repeat protein
MLTRYAADVVAYNNLSFCQTQLRDMPGAVKSVKQAAQILPKRALYRLNLALYAAYAGDFETAVTEAKNTQDLGNPLGLQPLAYAQVAQRQLPDALATYRALGAVGPQGASIAASGIADLAVYEGRFAEAARLYEQGAATDLMQNNVDRAAAKLTALAHVQLLRGRRDLASAAATKAIATSQAIRTRLLAARLLIDAGQPAKAEAVAMQLASELPVEAQASAKILEGDLALAAGKLPQAIKALGDANDLLDTWIGQFDLGRAFFAANRMTQADSAFDRCITRSGELFLDEEPSYGYLPSAYYYRGRVREDQKSVAFADSYRTYLSLREKAGEDPLLKDVRKRAGS